MAETSRFLVDEIRTFNVLEEFQCLKIYPRLGQRSKVHSPHQVTLQQGIKNLEH